MSVNAPRAMLQSGRKPSTMSHRKLKSPSSWEQSARASANTCRHFLYGEPSLALQTSPMLTRKWSTFLRVRAAGSEVRGQSHDSTFEIYCFIIKIFTPIYSQTFQGLQGPLKKPPSLPPRTSSRTSSRTSFRTSSRTFPRTPVPHGLL